MKKTWAGISILFLAAILFIGGCFGGASEDPQAMQLRTYTVPEGSNVKDIQNLLNLSMDTGDQNLGHVVRSPDGSLVVTAPASVHDGIEALLNEMEERGPEPGEPEPASITIHYWFLVGRAGVEGVNIPSPILKQNRELQPVFEEIVKSQGGMEFYLLEQVRLSSLDNNSNAKIRGRKVSARQRVLIHDSGRRVADITLTVFKGANHTLETRIKLQPGQYVVLGQTSYQKNSWDRLAIPKDDMNELMLFYVISSEID